MAFCPNCGAAVEGRFCPKCGTAVTTGEAAGGAPQAGPTYGTPTAGTTSSGLSENVASALCYVLGLLTGIIFLVLAPYNQNKTIRFHAFQSIFLHVAWLAIWFASIFILHGFMIFVTPLVGLAFFIIWILVIIKAYQGQKLVLPVIGSLAQQQA